MDLLLKGRSALVTGASQGIGWEVVRLLAREGVRICAVARSVSRLDELAARVRDETGGEIKIIAADLTAAGAVNDIVTRLAAGFGDVDILMNVAGGSRPVAFDASAHEWEQAMTLNFFRVRELTHALVPAMRRRRWGRVINFTGMSEPRMLNATFSAKAAVHVWSKSLSREVGADGVTVNCLKPGTIHSAQMKRFFPTDEDEAAFVSQFVPVGRFGEPREIASLAVFLASPLGGYVTGAAIPVDGGYSMFAF